MQIYLVGGAVRDQLLNYPVYDRDWVVVGATPEEMLEQGFKPVGKDFPVFIHPDSGEEYALARTERKSGKGYTGFQYHASPDVTLEQDLIRRDLTINAMAMTEDKQVIDPYGGQKDLLHKQLRHVSPAFSEDPLRVLRVARFLARYAEFGFTIAPETLALMTQLAQTDELEHLTSERVWQEFQRALGENRSDQFLTALLQCQALPKLFPQLLPAVNDPQLLNDLQRDIPTEARFALLMLSSLKALSSETRGEAVKQFCEQNRVPNSFRDLSLQLCCNDQALLHYTTLTGEQRLHLIRQLDLLRRPEKLTNLIPAITVLNDGTDPEIADQLPTLLQALQTIQPRQLMQEGYKGKALGDEIARRQLQLCDQQSAGELL